VSHRDGTVDRKHDLQAMIIIHEQKG